MSRPIPVEERFWSKVRITPGCWEWQASVHTQGYGQIGVGYRPRLAHRVSYEMSFGPIPDGLIVRHKCDNRLCVNPDHLELGTHTDNMRDMVERGRSTRGEKSGHSVLTIEQVREIRASSDNQYRLAERYGVTQSHISSIQLGKRWGDVA